MATFAKNLLKANLSENADYETIQLLKADELGKAAKFVLTARGKALTLQVLIFFGILIPFFLLNVAFAIPALKEGGEPRAMLGFVLGIFLLPALVQVPMLLKTQAALTRLETIFAMWLMENPDSQERSEASIVELLSS